MAGTASVFTDCTDNTNYKSRNIGLLASWLFGRVNTGCILTDISTCGGASLIPKNQPSPSGLFELVIMTLEKDDEALTTIQAEMRWLDENFSSTHKKIGFKFQNSEQVDNRAIESIIELLTNKKQSDIKCSILNR